LVSLIAGVSVAGAGRTATARSRTGRTPWLSS
jgi:hypothetical protein